MESKRDMPTAIEGTTTILSLALFAGLVLLTFMQVLCRYVFKYSLTGVEELARLAFVWGMFLGSAVLFGRRSHVTMDSVTTQMGQGFQHAFAFLGEILTLSFSIVMIVSGLQVCGATVHDRSTALGYHRNVFYFPGVVFGCLTLILVSFGIARRVRRSKAGTRSVQS